MEPKPSKLTPRAAQILAILAGLMLWLAFLRWKALRAAFSRMNTPTRSPSTAKPSESSETDPTQPQALDALEAREGGEPPSLDSVMLPSSLGPLEAPAPEILALDLEILKGRVGALEECPQMPKPLKRVRKKHDVN